jgi:hypothetical protein
MYFDVASPVHELIVTSRCTRAEVVRATTGPVAVNCRARRGFRVAPSRSYASRRGAIRHACPSTWAEDSAMAAPSRPHRRMTLPPTLATWNAIRTRRKETRVTPSD